MNERVDELQEKQGWTDETIATLALQWIMENEHEEAFTNYLEDITSKEES